MVKSHVFKTLHVNSGNILAIIFLRPRSSYYKYFIRIFQQICLISPKNLPLKRFSPKFHYTTFRKTSSNFRQFFSLLFCVGNPTNLSETNFIVLGLDPRTVDVHCTKQSKCCFAYRTLIQNVCFIGQNIRYAIEN